MKDIKAMANEILALTEKLYHISPVHPGYSEVLGQIVEKQAEVDKERTRIEDLNSAKYLLNRHGYAYKIFGPEDVAERVNKYAGSNDLGIIEEASIVAHIVGGGDWDTMSDVTEQDEANLYALIEGTRNDHPEWFGSD